jgi:tryptophan synthase alpha chain
LEQIAFSYQLLAVSQSTNSEFAMNPIDSLFSRLRASGKKAFMPFLTAGDPDVAGTVRLARALAGAGANLLELGFPYSDPVADGPVVQASYTRALDRGIKFSDMLACGKQASSAAELNEAKVPVVAMLAYSLIYRRGAKAFLEQATAAGFSGAIVPDLPFEEASDLAAQAAARDFKLIQLVTPTTPKERARAIARLSTGFIYCVSVAGITGTRDRLPEELLGQLSWLRKETPLPLCVGFGISKPEHVRMLREVADGIIVGSAIVRQMEQHHSLDQATNAVSDLARTLIAELNPN